ncbi:MliC family protein [Hwangdonia lutea]|uniref:MliC family protein n=1 Tax=Hwangdonia lutea TaxID=3075823 RepID=A0AA97ELL2_9FLAO|nr:MliC family protein [Hwangdonia sp. SCSIO 19198]WOD42679.1 MliC family protein [Hwangdonia sp. SCSIO 19198]
MIKKTLTITLFATLILISCKETSKQENTQSTTTETVKHVKDDIVVTTSTNKDGEKLELKFNNTKGTATLNFNGETIELFAEKAASGIWYKNDDYELRGKGNDIELKKDGKVIYKHTDDIVNLEVKNEKGDVLNMVFNNSNNTVKAYLNGGEQMDLIAEKAASGIWYKNDHYELRGKGNNYKLSKDGKTLFKN